MELAIGLTNFLTVVIALLVFSLAVCIHELANNKIVETKTPPVISKKLFVTEHNTIDTIYVYKFK